MHRTLIPLTILILLVGAFFWYQQSRQFDLPTGTTTPVDSPAAFDESVFLALPSESNSTAPVMNSDSSDNSLTNERGASTRQQFITDGTKHSIPLNEILSGGPGKDGIPSIDNPKFISANEADEHLSATDIGLGIEIKGEARFYPYQILVWHEIVNDIIADTPVLVTYCPLCATGVAFDPRINGQRLEFGVSGMLWQSNLLMYNRTGNPDTESLWSQILGEAVLGTQTGMRLAIVPSDTVRYGDWKSNHPTTRVLSRDTGVTRAYGLDPYSDYYTNTDVSFGATFTDSRLHPKAFVLGVERNGAFKAYHKDALLEGHTTDIFAGETVTIERIGDEIRMSIAGAPLPYIGGFWFSWIAVHPETTLFP
jgi:hypothetical protein